MSNLLYKELRLAAHPTMFVFMLTGALVLIPNYPYSVVFLFGCLAPFITFMFGRETRDIYYTALLPIKKGDVVKGKCQLVVFAQLVQLIISIPIALIRVCTSPAGNVVGMEANLAYYGFGLVIYSVFNMVLFTQFYKTAYKVGRAFILACIPILILMVVMEMLPHFPALGWLDSVAFADQLRQVPLLILGVIVYPLGVFIAYRIGVKRFNRVDL